MYSIYALVDPRDQSVRYVGMSKDAKRRLQRHLSQKDNPLMPWFQELAQERYKPTLSILETVESQEQAKERELYWIKHYAEQGAHLENYQGNARERSAWKEQQAELAYLTKEFSGIEDEQERQYVINVFLEMRLNRGSYWIDIYNAVLEASNIIRENHNINVKWGEIAQIMAKIFHINVEQSSGEGK